MVSFVTQPNASRRKLILRSLTIRSCTFIQTALFSKNGPNGSSTTSSCSLPNSTCAKCASSIPSGSSSLHLRSSSSAIRPSCPSRRRIKRSSHSTISLRSQTSGAYRSSKSLTSIPAESLANFFKQQIKFIN